MDGNALYTQVKYDKSTNTITLVKGHRWAFITKSAWKSVNDRWEKETSIWVGSNYLCTICHVSYLKNPFGYIHHEENLNFDIMDIIAGDRIKICQQFQKLLYYEFLQI